MRTLLLTGGAGFIGHHTVEHVLKNTDWNIVVIDSLNYAGNLNYLADIEILREKYHENYNKRLRVIFHDLRAPFSDTTIALLPKKIDYIIHMAAEAHVDRSITDPAPFVYSNVVGTMNTLDLMKRFDVEKFTLVSTDEVYGPSIDGHLHKEGEPHRPGNPYSASKSGAEALAYAYWNTYNYPIIITNTMNNFGERQHPEKFVPKTIKSILLGEKVTVHCKMKNYDQVVDISSRCWLHARNHADALLFLLVNGIPGERYNVTGIQKSVETMAIEIGDYLGVTPQLDYVDFHSFRRGHDMHYGLDGSKLERMGWGPPMRFDTSLERTVSWFKENKEWLGL